MMEEKTSPAHLPTEPRVDRGHSQRHAEEKSALKEGLYPNKRADALDTHIIIYLLTSYYTYILPNKINYYVYI